MDDDDTYILGDIDAFLAALARGEMQAEWDKQAVRHQALIHFDPTSTPYDASES